MSAFLTANGFDYKMSGREGVFDRQQHPRRDPRGQGSRESLGQRASGSSIPIMGVPFWRDDCVVKRGRTGQCAFCRRPAGRTEPARPSPIRSGCFLRPTPSVAAHGLGDERPDREPDHRGKEPRPSTKPPAMAACCTSPMSAPGHRHPQRGHDRAIPDQRHASRPVALSGALVRIRRR